MLPALVELGMFDLTPEPAWAPLTRTAARLLDAPVSFVSIIDRKAGLQYFKSHTGFIEPWYGDPKGTLDAALCPHVVETETVYRVRSLASIAPENRHPLVRDLNAMSYLGAPVFTPDGTPIGALCVLDVRERDWTDEDVAALSDLASSVTEDLRRRILHNEARRAHLAVKEAHRQLSRYNALRESISMAFMAPDIEPNDRIGALLRAGASALGMDRAAILKTDGGQPEILFQYPPVAEVAPGARLSGSLTELVLRGQEQVVLPDVAASAQKGLRDGHGEVPGAYIGAPLLIDDMLYGVVEFSAGASRRRNWADEELSLVSIITMFLCAFIDVFAHITALRASQSELLQALSASEREGRSVRRSEG